MCLSPVLLDVLQRLLLDTTCPKTPCEPVFFIGNMLGAMENSSNKMCFRNFLFLMLPLLKIAERSEA